MIVEFTGCTGSGKTTISAKVIKRLLEQGLKVGCVHPGIIVKSSFINCDFADISSQDIRTDVRAFPWFLLSAIKDAHFMLFALKMILARSESFHAMEMNTRSLMRKVGIHRYLRCKGANDWVVVVDEGIIHSAHNLLVHVGSRPSALEIDEFSRMVPLPDLIVHCRAPKEMVIERTIRRKDRSPRVTGKAEAESFAANAFDMFETLMHAERISRKTFTVNYDLNDLELADLLANLIVECIIKQRNAGNAQAC